MNPDIETVVCQLADNDSYSGNIYKFAISYMIAQTVRETLEDYEKDFVKRWGTNGDMYWQISHMLTLDDSDLANLGETIPNLIAGGHVSYVNRLMIELTKLWKED